jgi:hypothetical protein
MVYHLLGKRYIHAGLWFENLNERHRFEDLGINLMFMGSFIVLIFWHIISTRYKIHRVYF